MRKIIYVCSPLKATAEKTMQENIDYANKCCKYVYLKGHMPLAPHTIFTQFLDDTIEVERKIGKEMGLQLLFIASEIWVFGNYISQGMEDEINYAKEKNISIKYVNTLDKQI